MIWWKIYSINESRLDIKQYNFVLFYIIKIFIIAWLFFFQETLYANEKLQKVSVQLKWKYQFQFAGFIAAKEKGFYKDAGLDVELLEYSKHTNTLESIKENKIQFGVSDSALILEALKNEPIVAMMAIYQKSPYTLMAKKSAHINDIKDLNGKKLAIYNDINGKAIKSILNLNNINFIEEPIDHKLHKLQNGMIDAAIAYISNEPYVAKEMGMDVTTIDLGDSSFSRYGDILFTLEDTVKNNPELVKKMYEATKKGFEYAFSNKDELIDIIYKKYNTQIKSKDALKYEAKILEKLAGLGDTFGELDQAKIESIAYIYSYSEQIPYTANNLKNFIYQYEKQKRLSIPFTKEEKQWLQTHNEVTIGIRDLPPYIFERQGQAKGYHIELINMLLEACGLSPKYINNINFKKELENVKDGKIDISLALYATPEREQFIDFNNFTYIVSMAIFTQKNRNDITNFESLKGKRIASYHKYGLNKTFEKYFPNAKIVYADDMQGMFELVSKNKADFCVQEIYSGEYMIRKLNSFNLVSSGVFETPNSKKMYANSWGVSKKSPLLKSILDKAYDSISESEKDQLWKKWFGNAKVDGKFTLTQKEKKYIQSHIFNRGYPEEWNPFYIYDKAGKNIGLVEDYWNLIKNKIGLKEIITKMDSFPQIMKAMENGKTDIYPSTTKVQQREKFGVFSNIYEKFPIAFATKSDSGFISDPKALEGHIVAVGKRTSAYYLMREKYPNIKYLETDNVKDAIEKVKNGEAYAAIDVLPVLKYHVFTFGQNKINIAGITDIYFNMRVMIRKEHKELVPIINKAIASITAEEKSQILQKWLQPTIVKTIDYSIVLWPLFIFLLLILLVMFWNWTLRKQVKIAIEKYQAQEILLVQNARKAEVGNLLGAITHQIKQSLNIINIIISDMEFKLLLSRKDEIPLEDNLKKILKQTDFMNNTINDFKYFFNPNSEIAIFNPKDSIYQVTDLFFGIFLSAQIEFDIEEIEPFTIETKQTELMQVLLVIFNNSRDAFIERNTKKRKITCRLSCDIEYGIIEIEDNAGGIPDTLLPFKIFENYVSTKGEKGSGIGLNICKMIIEEKMQGKISASNTKNGALFTLKLPKKIIDLD